MSIDAIYDPPPRNGAGRILVCDDTAQIRTLIRVNLELEGYEVVEAGDGQEALGILEVARNPMRLTQFGRLGDSSREVRQSRQERSLGVVGEQRRVEPLGKVHAVLRGATHSLESRLRV